MRKERHSSIDDCEPREVRSAEGSKTSIEVCEVTSEAIPSMSSGSREDWRWERVERRGEEMRGGTRRDMARERREAWLESRLV